MIRQIIKIDENKCNGCGLCAQACHEGAIGMINGKAKLLREDYCDGLGDCLPVCPTGAISFERRDAAAFVENKEAAVLASACASSHGLSPTAASTSTAASASAATATSTAASTSTSAAESTATSISTAASSQTNSRLRQWPVQIKLAPVNAPYFDNADLLVAADCSAYAYGRFHEDFMANRVTLIGCPKLDAADYSEKLTAILMNNNIASVTVSRMEVPCCGGIEYAVRTALQNSGKEIPWQVVTITTDGRYTTTHTHNTASTFQGGA